MLLMLFKNIKKVSGMWLPHAIKIEQNSLKQEERDKQSES